MTVTVVLLTKVTSFVFIYHICICSIKHNLLVGYTLYVYVTTYWDINYYINFTLSFPFDLVYSPYNVHIYETWSKSCNCILYISMVDPPSMWIGRETSDTSAPASFRVKALCLTTLAKSSSTSTNPSVRIPIFFPLIPSFTCETINEKNYGTWLTTEIYRIDQSHRWRGDSRSARGFNILHIPRSVSVFERKLEASKATTSLVNCLRCGRVSYVTFLLHVALASALTL